MDMPASRKVMHLSPCCGKRIGVGCAFIPQRIELAGDDDRRRQTTEISRSQW